MTKLTLKSNKKATHRALPCVLITMGDPRGIGAEVTRKALHDGNIARKIAQGEFHCVVIGDKDLWGRLPDRVETIDIPYQSPGHGALLFLDKAIALIKEGRGHALVTAPLSKEAVSPYSKHFVGHTEYLARAFKVKKFDMMFVAAHTCLTILTRHVPLKNVPALITPKAVYDAIVLMNTTLKTVFRIKDPKIAVLGLNPHAGENGLLGAEDKVIILPSIRKAQVQGINVQGPFPADTFFMFSKPYDGVIAMYHDQGLIPMKAMHPQDLVNFTAGLPFVRTSPAHGTAFDIAGKDKADAASMRAAIDLACSLLL